MKVFVKGDPYPGLDGVLGGAIKSLDSEMLFDPLEKQLHLPAVAIQFGDRLHRQRKIVGQKHKALVAL
ncbi:MAG: hypothetical protein RBS58_10770 [Syntrophales bacterium]|jgi:hypothetical protein|nr:hypothetical protein [Syntrophales bacterium]MDX9923109.1 hypothetical protein [Syntrophales bacterium]